MQRDIIDEEEAVADPLRVQLGRTVAIIALVNDPLQPIVLESI